MNKIDYVSKKNLRDKILNYLSSESMHAGSNTFTIPYDRQGLADYLNADRSALSSELSKLQKEGVLSYKKNTFSLGVKENSKYTFGKYCTEGEVHEKSMFDDYILGLGVQRPRGLFL